MRFPTITLALCVPLLAGLAVAGCSSSPAPVRANLQVTVSGTFGTAPAVTIPAMPATADLVYNTLVHGTGPVVAAGNAMLTSYVEYNWDGSTHKLGRSTYVQGYPAMFGSVPSLRGLKDALIGQKAGSRVLVVVPPKFGFGSTGSTQLGVTGKTTMVFVFDILGTYSPSAIASGTTVSSGGGTLPKVTTPTSAGPTVVIPKTSPPSTLVAQPLIKGTGRAVTRNDTIVAQYILYDWRTRQSIGSSWSSGSMIGSPVTRMIPGLTNGLVGQTVGSRVLLVIPASQAYGSKGSSDGTIKGGDTLVFVVDIIDAVAPAS